MDLTKHALSDAVERLRQRKAAGEIDDDEFRILRDKLLERRVAQRPFDGPERRDPPTT